MISKKNCIIVLGIVIVHMSAKAQENTGNLVETRNKSTRIQILANVGMHSTPSDPNVSPYVLLSPGVNIKDRAYLGLGAGVLTCFVPYMKPGYMLLSEQYGVVGSGNRKDWTIASVMPLLYIQSDIYLTKRQSWRPYVSVSVGTSFIRSLMTVGYSKLGVGVEYKGLALQIGYTPMYVKYSSNVPQPQKPLSHGLYFDAGYRFDVKEYKTHTTVSESLQTSSGTDGIRLTRKTNTQGTVPRNETHFQGIGYVGISAMPIPMPSTTLSLGVLVKGRYFFGAGLGALLYVDNYHDADPTNKSYYAYPLSCFYLQSDIYMKHRNRCSPYITFAAGSVVPYVGSLKAGIGVDYRSFVWQLAYSPAFLFAAHDYVMHGLTFNFGYRFGTAKYNRQR